MRGLVLSGGGSKGAYQVGVLKKLLAEDQIQYDLVAGISVGAINAAMLTQAPKGDPKAAWDFLNQQWLAVDTNKIRKGWCPFGMLSALWKPAAYNSEPLQKWVRSGIDAAKTKASGMKLRIVAVSWDSGESRVVDETVSDLASWVLASSSYPGMFLPISIDGELWTDGGVRDVTPLGEAIRAGCTDIDVVLTADPDLSVPFKSAGKAVLPDLAFRALELMSSEIMRSDLKICGLKNDLAGPYRKINLRVFQPKIDLTEVTSSLDFEPKAIAELVTMGYEDATLQIKQM